MTTPDDLPGAQRYCEELKAEVTRLRADLAARDQRWADLRRWAEIHGHDLTGTRMAELETAPVARKEGT